MSKKKSGKEVQNNASKCSKEAGNNPVPRVSKKNGTRTGKHQGKMPKTKEETMEKPSSKLISCFGEEGQKWNDWVDQINICSKKTTIECSGCRFDGGFCDEMIISIYEGLIYCDICDGPSTRLIVDSFGEYMPPRGMCDKCDEGFERYHQSYDEYFGDLTDGLQQVVNAVRDRYHSIESERERFLTWLQEDCLQSF